VEREGGLGRLLTERYRERLAGRRRHRGWPSPC